MADLALIRAELRALDDADLFARSVEIVRVAHDNRDADGLLLPLDRAWRRAAWQEWIERKQVERFTEALGVVRAELLQRRLANRSSI